MNDFTTGAPTDRLPTLVRTRRGYRVHDPALLQGTSYVIDDAGDLVYTKVPAGVMTASAFLAATVTAVTVGAHSWTLAMLVFVIGLPVAFAAAAALLSLVHAATDPVRRYRARFGNTRFALDVTDRSSADWQLCARAERLAASRSWQAGRIDPTRTLGGLLWTAVGGGETWAAGALTTLAEPATGPDLTSV
ncbi:MULTISPECIES: hypothetical protein [unclassified Pseudonocardia]|uniref:hypothetical protein n=1 Tax=unclassified Pseudonocardia TaxID=2619320 RepID=UPI0001FFF055|nr:hypothetical protein [Pseudonocardia sp. Ae707_Ps1]OLM17072.1 hypothetical protein Ae707Ps1_1331c [Pseudonocardia sp. Ae707_Ps1]